MPNQLIFDPVDQFNSMVLYFTVRDGHFGCNDNDNDNETYLVEGQGSRGVHDLNVNQTHQELIQLRQLFKQFVGDQMYPSKLWSKMDLPL